MFERLRYALASFYGRVPPADEAVWHKWRPLFPFVTLDNGKTASLEGQIWRRRTATGWEYRQDPETPDEWSSGVW